jgi:2-polyprenyl-6-hydroxyphenyl methylase/3-demethylubiquinone-9 3-methyltransferase
VLIAIGVLWTRGEGVALRAGLPLAVAGWSFFQWSYWVRGKNFRAETGPLVDNEFYDELGELWHRVKGVDRSASSLSAARARVPAGADATYAVGDALALAEPLEHYDAVLMMDLLEHVDDPARAIAEAARALRPGGVLIFHTFNRTPESWLLAVKGIGFVTREGPSNVHAHSLFITPAELEAAGKRCGLGRFDATGIRPMLDGAFVSSVLNRRVHPDFAFTLTRSTRVGYVGCLTKL